MDQRHEQVVFQAYHHRIYKPEFISGLTIFFGLSGSCTVRYESAAYALTAGALLVVNPFEMYHVDCPESSEMIAMQIPEKLLQVSGWNKQTACFCYASGSNEKNEYQQLRVLFATIFQDYFQDRKQKANAIASNVLQIIHILITNFLLSDTGKSNSRQEESMRRMKRIMDYIHSHWNEDISLHELAEREFLSEGYLSRFLRQNLDMTYSQYVSALRLSYAEELLRTTEHSITHIAYDCGFRNASALIESFRQKYGITPGQYRKKQTAVPAGNQEQKAEQLQNGFAFLLQYALPSKPQKELNTVLRKVTVSDDAKETNLRHTWRTLLNGGYAKHLLTAEVQRQIIRVQQEIGFRYLRFHGILDDSIHIYQGKTEHSVQCCFTYFDMIIDFLLDQGLLPFLEFSFMPSALAKERKSIYESGSITAACMDTETFGKLIEEIVRHSIQRYGWESVRKWKFTTLQINYVFFRCITIEEYLEIYSTAYRSVKRADPRLKFGGPGAISGAIRDARGLRKFLQFARENDCMPDFFSVQCYPHESVTVDAEFMDYTLNQQSIPSVLSKDINFVTTFLKDMQGILREFDVADCKVYLEEWNSTLWQRDLSSDTCYKSVWLVKNICENMDGAECFGYWTFSDFIDERADFHTLYHGGYGLFTYNGISKSGYEALRLLRMLGDQHLASGDGWYLTRQGEAYQLMLYNYSHYDNIYRYRYRRLEHPEDAYSVFEDGQLMRFQISLPVQEEDSYIVEQREISREHGSSFDAWLNAGAPANPGREMLRYLKGHADAGYHVSVVKAEKNLKLELELKPMEVRLITIKNSKNNEF